MTWNQLKNKIDMMTEEQKNTSVTVYDNEIDEFFPVIDNIMFSPEEDDVLDAHHPYLVISQ